MSTIASSPEDLNETKGGIITNELDSLTKDFDKEIDILNKNGEQIGKAFD
jgi:hypothetical protein